MPFDGLRWFFDHAETVTERNLERIKALGGGIAIQHRMAYQGEYFIDRYGADAAAHTPPIAKMLRWVSRSARAPTPRASPATTRGCRCTGWWRARRSGGTPLYPEGNRLDRVEALRRYTVGSAWFSGEEEQKGAIVPGQLADLAVLSADYFSVPEDDIKGIESVLTMVGGKVVYAAGRVRRAGTAAAARPAGMVAGQGFAAATTAPVAESNAAAHAQNWSGAGWLHGLLHQLVAELPERSASRCGGWVVSVSHSDHVEGQQSLVAETKDMNRCVTCSASLLLFAALAGPAWPGRQQERGQGKVIGRSRAVRPSRCGWKGRTRPMCRCKSSAISSTPRKAPRR